MTGIVAASCLGLVGIPSLVYLLQGTWVKKDGISQQDQENDGAREGEFSMEGEVGQSDWAVKN